MSERFPGVIHEKVFRKGGEWYNRPLSLEDIRKDAEKVRPYDSVWDMFYDEFDELEVI